MISKEIIYYGRADKLPEKESLRAGPVELVFESGDLRYLRLGSIEVIRRIYVAVRDRHWDTVPGKISRLRKKIGPDRFVISFKAVHHLREIHFEWVGKIMGKADG